jgi:hypothetical protein
MVIESLTTCTEWDGPWTAITSHLRHRHKDEWDTTPGDLLLFLFFSYHTNDYLLIILFTDRSFYEWEWQQVSNFSNIFSYFTSIYLDLCMRHVPPREGPQRRLRRHNWEWGAEQGRSWQGGGRWRQQAGRPQDVYVSWFSHLGLLAL